MSWPQHEISSSLRACEPRDWPDDPQRVWGLSVLMLQGLSLGFRV